MPDGYALENEDWDALRAVLARLYDDRPLNGDSRRDLADRMRLILDRAVAV